MVNWTGTVDSVEGSGKESVMELPIRPVLIAFTMSVPLSIFGAVTVKSQAQQTDTLFAHCEKRTIVMGRDEKGDMIKVGEHLDDYCAGFLEGSLTMLARTKVICVKGNRPTPDFLLSTIVTYRTATKATDDDAGGVVEAVFKRAFSCQN